MTHEQAHEAMTKGHTVRNIGFIEDEYLYMLGGVIRDEAGYNMGRAGGEFWNRRMRDLAPDGWQICS